MNDAGIQIILTATNVPENLPHKTRKQEIEDLPSYLSASVAAPSNTSIVNYGYATPGIEARAYPWVRLNADGTGNGIWIWSGTEWVEAYGTGGNVVAYVTAYLDDHQIITSGVSTLVQLASVEFNVGSFYDETTYTFNVPHDGKYLVIVQGHYDDMDDDNVSEAQIDHNGTIVASMSVTSEGAFVTQGVSVSKILDCSATDTIKFYTEHNHGSDRLLSPGTSITYMSIVRVN